MFLVADGSGGSAVVKQRRSSSGVDAEEKRRLVAEMQTLEARGTDGWRFGGGGAVETKGQRCRSGGAAVGFDPEEQRRRQVAERR